ncbi:hypothetical protein [Lacticaseibacillus rhamnosus]|uniref:hypothetical protein n=1 Tax=Lacticaseibacillus rhamnosus TaxID=47715 RepID=UPI0022AB4BD1|nr:hypothetical protein [Lacticaseibacillus rhamnosus]MCZ2732906.1 hypothetical protein [Lacticaseibacillus rhamnosus]MCZ2735619.1 hypothetical protein [Lacticaseibacillus rhamnosus]MCZ2741656.1 hypothetical protein [Lacticaseibacillus rhamnosus]MCZ2744787.1 hypothetical protein [Lacticaseibacillus rhamnosus]MCZ2747037.1 hypothetical protein [Lacticaseibacillus rhamnosus]
MSKDEASRLISDFSMSDLQEAIHDLSEIQIRALACALGSAEISPIEQELEVEYISSESSSTVFEAPSTFVIISQKEAF